MNSTPTVLLRSQGLFSSHTAFQKPKPFLDSQSISAINSSLLARNYISNSLNRKFDSRPFAPKDEGSELLKDEPIKKVKLNPCQSQQLLKRANESETKELNFIKPTKLTIEEVFNPQTEKDAPKLIDKHNFFENDYNEGSSLSFISLGSSLDDLEEVEKRPKAEETNDFMIIEEREEDHKPQSHNGVSLVMKDNMFHSLEQIDLMNQTSFFNPLNHYQDVLFKQYNNTFHTSHLFQDIQTIENIKMQELIWNQRLAGGDIYSDNCEPNPAKNSLQFPNNLHQYIASQFINESPALTTMNNYAEIHQVFNLLQQNAKNFNNAENILNYKAKNVFEEDYDSDSNATKSTTAGGDVLNGCKSQKSSSPLSCINEEMNEEKYLEVKFEEQKLAKLKANERRGRPKKDKTLEPAFKEKRKRPLNLKIDLNPQHLKVERRLNKLQLLRYQKEGLEGDKINFPDVQETLDQKEDFPIERSGMNELKYSEENSAAIIPAFNLERPKRRIELKSRWNPEAFCRVEFSSYLDKLGEILEFQITNEETALSLLKANGMNVSMTLKVVKENILVYKEAFKIKIKRGRKRGMGF